VKQIKKSYFKLDAYDDLKNTPKTSEWPFIGSNFREIWKIFFSKPPEYEAADMLFLYNMGKLEK
jgi:hypothetical protein